LPALAFGLSSREYGGAPVEFADPKEANMLLPECGELTTIVGTVSRECATCVEAAEPKLSVI
jgi:hypothetical protein